MATGDPSEARLTAAGAASTIRPDGLPLRRAGSACPDGVVVEGAGPVVVGTVGWLRPAPPADVVVGDDGRGDTGVVALPPAVFGAEEGAGAVVVVVATAVVVLDVDVTDELVARTALGGNVGCPSVPSMSVEPNVQASTLPAGGW
jgi:hypothetical protein